MCGCQITFRSHVCSLSACGSAARQENRPPSFPLQPRRFVVLRGRVLVERPSGGEERKGLEWGLERKKRENCRGKEELKKVKEMEGECSRKRERKKRD